MDLWKKARAKDEALRKKADEALMAAHDECTPDAQAATYEGILDDLKKQASASRPNTSERAILDGLIDANLVGMSAKGIVPASHWKHRCDAAIKAADQLASRQLASAEAARRKIAADRAHKKSELQRKLLEEQEEPSDPTEPMT